MLGHLAGRPAQKTSKFARVGREHRGRLSLGEELEAVGVGVQPVGVDEERRLDSPGHRAGELE